MSRVVEYGETCTELHLDTGAVAQVTAVRKPNEDNIRSGAEEGFLVRVWQPRGCVSSVPSEQQDEPGLAHNCTNLSAVISFNDDGSPRLESFDYLNNDFVTEFAASEIKRRERMETAEAVRARKLEEAASLRRRAARLVREA